MCGNFLRHMERQEGVQLAQLFDMGSGRLPLREIGRCENLEELAKKYAGESHEVLSLYLLSLQAHVRSEAVRHLELVCTCLKSWACISIISDVQRYVEAEGSGLWMMPLMLQFTAVARKAANQLDQAFQPVTPNAGYEPKRSIVAEAMADLRRRREGAAEDDLGAKQSMQVAGDGISQSVPVAGGGGSSQSAPVVGGGASQGTPAVVASADKTADQMLDELIEDLNKEEAPTAVVKSVRATEAAGSGLVVAGLSPEQQRWLANAAEAMRAGQAVAPMAAPGPAPEALAVVPVEGQRPGFLPPALPAEGHGGSGHQGGDDRGHHGGGDQRSQGGEGLHVGGERGDDQGQGHGADHRAQAGGGSLLGPLALPAS
eukprot:s3612_g3.t1